MFVVPCTLGGIASICFRFHFQQTLRIQIQGCPHLSNQYERYESQYTFVNPFETDLTNYLKFIFIMILRPHGSSFEIFDFEIKAFALE